MESVVFSLRDVVGRSVAHEALPAPVDPRLRRFAWTGTVLVAVLITYLMLAAQVPVLSAASPDLSVPVIGLGLLHQTVDLYGQAIAVRTWAVAALGLAAVAALLSKGFRFGAAWMQVSILLVGLAGTTAAVPVAVAAAVVVVNLIILIILACMAASAALLAIALTALFGGSGQ